MGSTIDIWKVADRIFGPPVTPDTMKVSPLHALLALTLSLSPAMLKAEVVIRESSDEGMDAFVIQTPTATYFYQKEAGGFFCILDNVMVFGSDDSGAGHPGFKRCISIQVDHHTIRSFSQSGLWQWSWRFFDKYAELTVESADPNHPYWFLYEGPIAGRFKPSRQYWGSNRSNGPLSTFPDYFKTGGDFDLFEWVYFGDKSQSRILFLHHLDPDNLPDLISYLGNSPAGLDSSDGMVVFGFGRYKDAKATMSKTPNRFRIGLIEKGINSEEDHREVAQFIQSIHQ